MNLRGEVLRFSKSRESLGWTPVMVVWERMISLANSEILSRLYGS